MKTNPQKMRGSMASFWSQISDDTAYSFKAKKEETFELAALMLSNNSGDAADRAANLIAKSGYDVADFHYWMMEIKDAEKSVKNQQGLSALARQRLDKETLINEARDQKIRSNMAFIPMTPDQKFKAHYEALNNGDLVVAFSFGRFIFANLKSRSRNDRNRVANSYTKTNRKIATLDAIRDLGKEIAFYNDMLIGKTFMARQAVMAQAIAVSPATIKQVEKDVQGLIKGAGVMNRAHDRQAQKVAPSAAKKKAEKKELSALELETKKLKSDKKEADLADQILQEGKIRKENKRVLKAAKNKTPIMIKRKGNKKFSEFTR